MLLKIRTERNESDEHSYTELLSKLSSLIERGRFFFPNIDRGDEFGVKKLPAYKGYRNLALDFLVASFNIYSDPNTRKSDLGKADEINRQFTSIIFKVIRPKENLDKIQSITKRYFATNEDFTDFLKNNDSDIFEPLWR
jgi:hypothetical protein